MKYSVRHEKHRQSSSEFKNDGVLALGLTLGATGTILLGLLFEYFSEDRIKLFSKDLAPIVVSLLVGLATAYLATKALLEQRKAREASTDPVLIPHLSQRLDAREMITFKISNVGAGAAINVRVNVQEPENISGRNIFTNIFKRHHPFSVIVQNDSVEFSLGMGWELIGETPMAPFNVDLAYQDLSGEEYTGKFMVDIREMEGLGADAIPEMRMVAALEDLVKIGKKLS